MNLINNLLPVITLILGWGISEFGKFSTERKNNGKKFKKLLFNLLELRWLLKKESDLTKEINEYTERFKGKLLELFGPDSLKETEMIKPMISEILKDKIVQPNRIKEIETNIDSIIIELAEIYPIFAYELSGKYNIKERLELTENYFKDISSHIENIPEELTEWIQPKLSEDLISGLDEHIIEIAGKINNKTQKTVIEKIEIIESDNFEEIDEFIEEYIERIKTMANNVYN